MAQFLALHGASTHGWVRAALLIGLVLPACADEEHGNPYAPGEGTYAPPLDDDGDSGSSPPDLPADEDSGGSTSSGGWDGGDEDGNDDGGSTTGGSTGGSTTGGTTGGTTTGGGGACAQPGTGMYAHCLDAGVCGGLPCFQIQQDNVVTDGFCTVTCASVNDCNPAPGDCSATPACVPVGGQNACALSCSGGASCPAGMQCMNVQGAGEVCV